MKHVTMVLKAPFGPYLAFRCIKSTQDDARRRLATEVAHEGCFLDSQFGSLSKWYC